VRPHVSDHAVTHALFVPLGQIRENDASHRVNCLATLRGQFLQIFLNGPGAALHNPISFTGLLAKTMKADTTRAKSTQAQNRLPNRIPLQNRVDSNSPDLPTTRVIRVLVTTSIPSLPG